MESGRCSRPNKSTESQNLSTGHVDIVYTNAQSIVNKIDELRSVNLEPDIILLNETWTNDDITEAYLNLDGYVLAARSDTANGRGGGLLVYNKIGLIVNEQDTNSTFNQLLSISIATS